MNFQLKNVLSIYFIYNIIIIFIYFYVDIIIISKIITTSIILYK